jgi:hypothetical protein
MKNISPSPSIPQTPKYLVLFIPCLNFDPTNQVILQENSKKEVSLPSKKDPKKRSREKERSKDQRGKEEKPHLPRQGHEKLNKKRMKVQD